MRQGIFVDNFLRDKVVARISTKPRHYPSRVPHPVGGGGARADFVIQ